ncbi:MAG: AI-2E family transporter [Anaerolineales bacterium]
MIESKETSPRWGSTTKMIVGLSIVALIAALLVKFRHLIGPLILAFMLSYLLYPVVAWLSKTIKIPWRTAVTLIYFLLLVILVGSFTLTGLAVVQQLQSLVGFIQNNVKNLPDIVTQLSQRSYDFGPFHFSLANYDLGTLTNQILSAVQPILGKAGSLISSIATSAAVTIGWSLFVLVISYFLLADAGRVSGELVHIEVPGYQSDFQRLSKELRNIWNAFLRGQLLIIGMVMLVYSVLMAILGVRFALGIAILAGVARLIPYVGPAVLWITTILVTYFQGSNYFGLSPLQYAILVVALAFLTDQIFDNIVAPRFMGHALGVHPAAVLIAAVIAANLIGLIGLILAAPTVATLKLFSGYITRKMFDLDPWPALELQPQPPRRTLKERIASIKEGYLKIRQFINKNKRA